jgi:hypothetical protein
VGYVKYKTSTCSVANADTGDPDAEWLTKEKTPGKPCGSLEIHQSGADFARPVYVKALCLTLRRQAGRRKGGSLGGMVDFWTNGRRAARVRRRRDALGISMQQVALRWQQIWQQIWIGGA